MSLIIRALAAERLSARCRSVNYVSATDKEALEAFQLITRLEGIIQALEQGALAHVGKIVSDLPPEHLLVMNMAGAAIRMCLPWPTI